MFSFRSRRSRRLRANLRIISLFLIASAISFGIFTATRDEYSLNSWAVKAEGDSLEVKADYSAFSSKVKMTAEKIEDKEVIDSALRAASLKSDEVLAFNITFTNQNGDKVQPNSYVKVTIDPSDYSFNAERYALVHIGDNGNVQYLGNVSASSDNKISFYANSFSIYAIIPTRQTDQQRYARYTYEFYVDSELVASQIVRNGDILNAPATPKRDGLIFMGWYTENNKVFNNLNLAVDIPDGTLSDRTIQLHGRFADKIYSVVFYNPQGNVLATKTGTTGDVINTVDMHYEVTAGKYVDAWTLDPEQSGEIPDGVEVDEVGDNIVITDHSIKLYPVIRSVKWIRYDVNDDDADEYTESTYVAAGYAFYGHVPTRPNDPVRNGYDFVGWSKDREGNQMYDFSAPLTEDTQLYAIWRPHASTQYRIVFWKEALVDGRYVAGNYEYASHIDSTGTSGSTITVTQAQVDSVLNQSNLADYVLDHIEDGAILHGDGSTIANVYLKMKVYTLHFVAETDSGSGRNRYCFNYYNGNTSSTSCQNQSYANTNNLTAIYTDSNGNQHDIVAGYSFEARMGEIISDRYPGSDSITLSHSSINNVKAYGWRAVNNNPNNTIRVSKPITMTTDLLLSDQSDGATLYLLGATTTNTITANYWFEKADGSGYERSDVYSFTVQSTGSGNFTGRQLYGYDGPLSTTPSGYESSNTNTRTYHFYYNRNQYSLYFYNYNTMGETHNGIRHGASLTNYDYIPERPAGLGMAYSFQGWYTTPEYIDGTEFDLSTSVMPMADLMLYAKWENTYYLDVTFNSNGGNDIPAQRVLYGGNVHAVTDPARVGYTFIGWRKTDGTFFSFDNIITEDTELVASWVPFDTIYVDYDPNGGSMDFEDVLSYVDTSTTAILPEPAEAPEGKYFVGWKVNGRIYYPGNIVMILLSDIDDGGNTITIVAEWGKSVDKTSITYNANTGIGNDITEVLEQNESFVTKTAAETGYIKDGYTLSGWNSAEDGSGVFYAIGTEWAADNRISMPNILYAQWQANPAVISYNANRGTGNMADTEGVTGQNVTLTSNTFTRRGYAFTGWNTAADGSGVAYADGANIEMPIGTTVLYAQWVANSASIVYNANGGAGTMASTNGVTDQVVTISDNAFTLTGYTFTGWNTAADGTGTGYAEGASYTLLPTATILYAQWTPNRAVIVYNANGGVGTMADTEGVTNQTVQISENVFTRAGYTFTGWNTAADGTGVGYLGGRNFVLTESSTVMYAQWSANPASITYHANGGTGVMFDTDGVTDEVVQVYTNTFTRDGYTFTGWNTAADGTGASYANGADYQLTPGVSDLYAQWSANPATLKYIANGGIGTMEDSVGVTDATISLSANTFTRDGYTFTGWNTKADGTGTNYANRADYVMPSGESSLYAQWQANPSKITYNANGGEGAMANTEGVTDQAATIARNAFTRDGYTFTGWNTAANGTGIAYAEGAEYTLTSTDLALYAQWRANPSKVTYNANGGEGTMTDTEGVVDQKITISDNAFTRDGYTFTGWNTAADGTGVAYAEGTEYTLTPTDLALYAQWQANPSKIVYDANGGSGDMANTNGVTDQTVAIARNTFTRDGYTFTGWNTKADGTGTDYAEGSEYTLTSSDLKLYAQWSANASRVIYYANGGEGTMVNEDGVTDQQVVIAVNNYTRDGYTFTGWNTAPDGTGTDYAEGTEYILKSFDLILYAQWQANPSKITYNANGGEGTMADTEGVVDQTVTISNNTFTRAGYAFNGWNTERDGSGTNYAESEEYVLTPSTLTLYAQWIADASAIIYNANGGNGTMQSTAGFVDQTVTISSNTFTRDGYTFTGWNTKADGTGTAYEEGAEYTLTPTSLILYAQWRANPSKITYNANGGEGTMTDTEGVVDQKVTISNNTFTRDGYTFTGWNTKADGTGTAYAEGVEYALTPTDLVLYAQWQANPSKIVYNANGGEGTTANTEGVTNQTVTIARNTFTRDGYTFTGWNTAADGTGTNYAEGAEYTLTPTDLILYAQWSANAAKISYNANGGDGTMADTEGVVDQTVTISNNSFTRDGYTFAGWNTAANGTGIAYAEGAEYTLTSTNLALYAQWRANPSKIVYNANGGEGSVANTEGVTDQKVNIAVNKYTRDGYTFTGWNTKADGTGTSYVEGAEYTLTPSDLTLYAQWSADESKIVYNANGGEGTMANTEGAVDQKVAISTNTFTRDGYTFKNWNTKADGTGTSYAEGAEYALTSSDLTLYAQWQANPSKIVYNANGGAGTMADTEGVTDQKVAVAANVFTRTGYTFTGWNTKADGTGTSYAEGAEYTLTSADLTLYAQWSANAAKISYNANGGAGTMADTEGVVDQKVTISNNAFTRDGYTFTGWNTKADGTGTAYVEGAEYILTPSDLALYAQWQANPSKITYSANGGEGTMANTEGVVDQKVSIASNVFTRTGYTFTGWNTKADGTGTSYAEGAEYILTSTELELYAQWSANAAKISYNANGGEGTMADTDGVTDEEVSIAANTFTRAGYTFTGWNTKADGTGTTYTEGASYTLTSTVTILYAQWQANPSKIIYNANGGEGTMDDTNGVTDQEVSIAINAFTRTGYTFKSWNTKADGTGVSYAGGDNFILRAEDTTLYAQWQANPSKIVYDANGGEGFMEYTEGVINQTVTVSRNTFTRDGYTFKGWNTAADGTGTAYAEGDEYILEITDLTLYAQWKQNEENPEAPATIDGIFTPIIIATMTFAGSIALFGIMRRRRA